MNIERRKQEVDDFKNKHQREVTYIIFYLLGHWGECDPQTCPKNDLYTQDDNQKALEAKELIDQYKASDANNEKLDSSLNFGTRTTRDCPCVKATQCKRMDTLLTNAKELSRVHPERKEIINYIRSQICDAKNQAVRCCGTQVVDDRDVHPTTAGPTSGSADKVNNILKHELLS